MSNEPNEVNKQMIKEKLKKDLIAILMEELQKKLKESIQKQLKDNTYKNTR
jgi:hypothetical protein